MLQHIFGFSIQVLHRLEFLHIIFLYTCLTSDLTCWLPKLHFLNKITKTLGKELPSILSTILSGSSCNGLMLHVILQVKQKLKACIQNWSMKVISTYHVESTKQGQISSTGNPPPHHHHYLHHITTTNNNNNNITTTTTTTTTTSPTTKKQVRNLCVYSRPGDRVWLPIGQYQVCMN